MSLALFDEIHDDAYLCDRTNPVTIEEFVEFGLTNEDYHYYLELLQELQSEFIKYGYIKSSTILSSEKQLKATFPTLEKLISFCVDKHLIINEPYIQNTLYYDGLFKRSDAEYYHGYIRYPKDFDEFRLILERKLSTLWDEEEAYITDTFGYLVFEYDDCYDESTESWQVSFDSPVRIYKYDGADKPVILKNKDVIKLFDIAKKDKAKIENKMTAHLKQIPSEKEAQNKDVGLPWIKELYKLYDLQHIICNVCETIQKAVDTPDILEFEETETLYVFCGTNTCKESGHLVTNVRVNLHFYNKPNKHYTIQRCAHCRQFQITLKELVSIIDTYGVPCVRIVYDDDKSASFSDFSDDSVLRGLGYTVSQSSGLTAEDRQRILKYAINSKTLTKSDVLSFLKRRMIYNGAKPGNEIAFQKWKEDYNFISQL